MSKRREMKDLQKVNNRLDEIEKMLMESSPEVFENINYLLTTCRFFNDKLTEMSNGIGMLKNEIAFRNKFLMDEKLTEKFQKYREDEIEKLKAKENATPDEQEQKLKEQEAKLKELEGNENAEG